MRARHSRSARNHQQKVPHPTASGRTSAWTLAYTSTTSLFHIVSGLATGVIFFLLKVFVIFALAVFVISWVGGEDSITIASFTDIGLAPAETTTPSPKGLGQFVADALAFELDRISQLHTVKNPWGSPEQIGAPKVTMPEAYERVGSISVSGIELPVGELFLALKSFLPHFNQRQAITGSLQRFSSDTTSRMRIIARLEEDGKILKHWEVDQVLRTEAELVDLIKELAFKISWSTLSDLRTNSFYSFQHYIDGMEFFRRYKDTHDKNHFHAAEQKLLAALQEHPEHTRAHFFLGSLYTWRFYYERNEGIIEEFVQKSVAVFQAMDQISTSPTHLSKALANFGLGLLAHRRYMKAKQENTEGYIFNDDVEKNLKLWLRQAEYFYTSALQSNKNLHFVKTARALVYKEWNAIDQAIQELHGAIHQESVEEECRKRNNRQRDWSQRQLDQLQAQKKRMEEDSHGLGVNGQDPANQNKEGDFVNWQIIPGLPAFFRWASSQDACTEE